MAAGRSMNLLDLQQSSDTIATLLSTLENPRGLDLDGEEKQKRRMSVEQVEVPQEQDATMRMSIPSIKTLGTNEQRSEDEDEEFADAASSDSDFLEYEPDELCGVFDSLNLAHCYENIHLLLGRFKTDAKTSKTAEISAWFQATAHLCNQSEADLEEKETACIEDFNHLEAAYHDLQGHLEGKQVTIVQCMRRFYNKVLSLRPELNPTYSEAKRKSTKKVGFQFPTLAETQEAKRKKEEQRRNRLQKEMQSHKSLEEGEALNEDQPKKTPEQTSETQEKKAEKKRSRTASDDPDQQTNAAMIAQDLLALISDQQDEIAHLRSQADVNTKSTEAMKMALEYVRHERESEDAEQMGGKAKKRQGALNDLGKEVLNDVVEQARMKCITELLVTNEGRAFLETTDGAAKMLEAHSRGQNVMEEIEELKTQMEVLQEQIGAVGDRSDRENQLRQTISERKRAIAMQEEADRRAIEAAAEAEKQQQLQQQYLTTPKGKGSKKNGARKTLARSDTTGLATLNEDESNIFGSLEDSSEDQSLADALLGMPDLSWLFEQTPETQKQLDQLTRSMEKCMSTVTAVKSKLYRALEDSVEAAVDDELERLKKEEEGIVDFGSGSRDVESVSQIKEKIKEQRRQLEEERAKTQQLEEHDLELKANIRKLKKSQREHELEAKNKSRALGTSMAKKTSQDQGDGTLGKKRSSVSYSERQKRLAMQSGQAAIPEEPTQALDENGEPLPTDIQEVRGQVRVVGKEIESLQKKEAQLQSLAEAALKRYSQASLNRARLASDTAEPTDTGATDPTNPDGLHRDLQREALQKASSPNPGNLVLSPSSGMNHGEGSRGAEHRAEGDSSAHGDSKDMSLARSKSPGNQGSASNSDHINATEAALQFGPGDESDKRSSSKRQSKQSQQSQQSLQSVQSSEVASSDAGGHGGRSSADSGKNIVVALESQNTVVVDKREQQVKELLFYQSENDRLQKQISGVEKKIREAKLKSLNPDQNVGQVAPVIAKDATLPEENRQMRREVRQRQRELNSLRKRWQIESDKHKRGAYENNIPGQLEAALKLLLKAPPDASELQAKVEEEEEAKKRAQEEADRLASEAAAKAKEEEEEFNRRVTVRSSVSSLQSGWDPQQGQSGFNARKSSIFQSGAHKMSVSAKELGSLFSAAAYKVQSPQATRASGQSLFPALSTHASPPRSPMSAQSDGRKSQSSTLSETLAPDVMRTPLGLPSRSPATQPNRTPRLRHAGTLAQEPPEGWQDLFFGPSTTRVSQAEPEEDLAIMGQKSRLSVEPKAPINDKRRNSSLSSMVMFGQGRRTSSLLIPQRSPRLADQFERVHNATAQPEDLNLAVVGQKEANQTQGIDLNRAADLITQKALANKDVSRRTLVKQSSLPVKSFMSSLANDLGLPNHDSPKSSQEAVVRGSVKSSHSAQSSPGNLASWGVGERHPKSSSFQDTLPETHATRPSLAMGSAVSALKQRLTSQLPSHGWQKMGTQSTLPGIEESS